MNDSQRQCGVDSDGRCDPIKWSGQLICTLRNDPLRREVCTSMLRMQYGRRGFEVLIRKLLAYKHKPALIVLHWWSPQTRDFWQSAEDELEVFSKCAATFVMSRSPQLSCNVLLWCLAAVIMHCCDGPLRTGTTVYLL